MLALMLAGLPLFAQTQTQTETDPSVAHLSLIEGQVSMQRGSAGQWMAATVNTPLMPGDSIATGPGSRAEIQLDYSNVLRLAQNSEAKIADLTRSRIQLQVANGTADLVVFQGNQASAEVDTPNVAVEPLRPGTYRIGVNSTTLSLVTVRNGEAQVSTPQGSTTVREGQHITIEGAQNPQYQVAAAASPDDWDNWNAKRNQVFENAQSYNHVNRYYTGAQNLGGYGHWVYVPNYDWCWTPYVNAGWVPYSSGRWVWEPYYGWTWVSYEPWGWAPFHYGRWFFYGSSWYWWPGYVTPYYYPVWGPAWVSFIGFGYGYYHFSFGFGYGFRSIGWCPLGPRDRFHRWWGRGHSFNVVNYHNYYGRDFGGGRRGFRGSNLEAAFSNEHVRRAITMMPADRFGREAVGRNRHWANSTMLRQADLVHGTLPVVPSRESLHVTNRAGFEPAVARSRANNTHFFSRRPVSARNFGHSFNTQAASIRRMVQTHNARNVQANRGYQFSRPTGAQGTNRATSAERVQTNRRSVQGNAQGWRRFGPFTRSENGRTAQQNSVQTRGNTGRQGAAPVVRETPRSNQNVNQVNRRVQRSNQQNMRGFGTGSSAGQSRGNSGRQGPAPVVRETPRSNSRNFQRSNPRADSVGRSQQNGRNGFRRFTPQPAPQSAPRNQGRFFNNSRAAPQRGNGNRAGWSPFTPQQRGGGGSYNQAPQTRQHYQPRYQYQRPPNYRQQYSRPPLRLNKPIVTQRRQVYRAPRARQENRGSFHRSAPRPSHGGGGHHRR